LVHSSPFCDMASRPFDALRIPCFKLANCGSLPFYVARLFPEISQSSQKKTQRIKSNWHELIKMHFNLPKSHEIMQSRRKKESSVKGRRYSINLLEFQGGRGLIAHHARPLERLKG
jgi:hypothetical protein